MKKTSIPRWRQEIAKYNTRMQNIKKWPRRLLQLSKYVKQIPSPPMDYYPSDYGFVALGIAYFTVSGCIYSATEAVRAFLLLWQKGLFDTVTLPARRIYELWAVSHYANQVLRETKESHNTEKALRITKQLLVGVRSEVQLPYGGVSSVKSLHIKNVIRSLKNYHPEAEKEYDFLSESCHFSFLRSATWLLIGPSYSNWANKKYRTDTHRLLENTLSSTEHALEGMLSTAKDTLCIAIPVIKEDKSRVNRR